MDIGRFPEYFQAYRWEKKHFLFGYPADEYPDFRWIESLEQRFIWVRSQVCVRQSSARYLVREMIEWGGSQNGVLQKFDDGLGEVNLYNLMQQIVTSLDSPQDAIAKALEIPGLGLAYASKLLRFLEPDIYGALDSRIRRGLLDAKRLGKIHDSSMRSVVGGYVEFIGLIDELEYELKSAGIRKPNCALSSDGVWRPADIEMALFSWADKKETNNVVPHAKNENGQATDSAVKQRNNIDKSDQPAPLDVATVNTVDETETEAEIACALRFTGVEEGSDEWKRGMRSWKRRKESNPSLYHKAIILFD